MAEIVTGLIQGVNFSGLVSYIYFDFTLCTFNHVKVVLEGYHRYFFGVKVKTVKLMTLRLLYMPAQIMQMMAFTQIMAIWTPLITIWDH